jgi:flavin-dependent dehydrogenase
VNVAPRRRIIDDGVLLVGDAAEIADPQSGEGIRHAVESGLLAAQTIIEARGQFSSSRLEPYAARLQARFATVPLSGAIARIVPDRVKPIVAEYLLDLPAFVKHVVLDQWFLHRRQAALDGC